MKTHASKRFLLMFGGFTLCLLLAYLLLFKYQLGAQVKAAWWVKNIYTYKEFVAGNTPSPKIIIVAGSNGLFGIDSAIIEQRTSMPVVNMAVHGALGLRYLYFNIEDYARDGDVVVIPLEESAYFKGYNGWFVNNMLAWGKDSYLGRVPLGKLLEFIVHVPPMRVLEGVAKQTGANPILPQERVVAQVRGAIETEDINRTKIYGHRSLNRYGDLLVEHAPTAKLLEKFRNGVGAYRRSYSESTFSESFVHSYEKLMALRQERDITVLFTWPVSIRGPEFDLSIPQYQQKVEEFRRLALRQGVRLYCNPALFNLNIRFFHDTVKHLNRYGAIIRSENLGDCLRTILRTGADEDMSFPQALETVRAQEASYGDAADALSVD